MTGNVNGVGANQEVGYVQKQDGNSVGVQQPNAQPNAIIQTNVNTQGVGTTVQSDTNFNLYGNDIANFEKFGGNDKNDAMRLTSSTANDVKRAYMQLQHDFPDAVVAFEPMPDPKTCGKKREGFFNYQMLLEQWKTNAFQQIENARDVAKTNAWTGAATPVEGGTDVPKSKEPEQTDGVNPPKSGETTQDTSLENGQVAPKTQQARRQGQVHQHTEIAENAGKASVTGREKPTPTIRPEIAKIAENPEQRKNIQDSLVEFLEGLKTDLNEYFEKNSDINIPGFGPVNKDEAMLIMASMNDVNLA